MTSANHSCSASRNWLRRRNTFLVPSPVRDPVKPSALREVAHRHLSPRTVSASPASSPECCPSRSPGRSHPSAFPALPGLLIPHLQHLPDLPTRSPACSGRPAGRSSRAAPACRTSDAGGSSGGPLSCCEQREVAPRSARITRRKRDRSHPAGRSAPANTRAHFGESTSGGGIAPRCGRAPSAAATASSVSGISAPSNATRTRCLVPCVVDHPFVAAGTRSRAAPAPGRQAAPGPPATTRAPRRLPRPPVLVVHRSDHAAIQLHQIHLRDHPQALARQRHRPRVNRFLGFDLLRLGSSPRLVHPAVLGCPSTVSTLSRNTLSTHS